MKLLPSLLLILFLSGPGEGMPFAFKKNSSELTNPVSIQSPQTQRYLLNNGLTVLVKEDHCYPLVAIETCVKTGLRTEGKFTGSGISHFVEHMIFKGTASCPANLITRQIKSYGGEFNASTSLDWTSFKMTIPVEHLESALSVLADCLSGSAFDANELEKERLVILNEIRLHRDNPGSYLGQVFYSIAYTSHPYKFPILGDESLFKRLTRDDLLEYYKSNYVPNNIVIGIVGDIDAESACQMIEKIFADFQPVPVSPLVKLEEIPQIDLRRHIEERAVGITHLALGFHSTSLTHPDVYPLDVLAIILGQGRSSHLYQQLYEKRGLVYSVEAWNFTPFDAGLFGISCELEAERLEEVIDAVLQEIEEIKKGRFQEKELKKAKNTVLSEELFGNETLQSQAHLLVAGEVIAGDFNFSARYLRGINSVKKEDVVRVAKEYLNKDNLTIVALVPESKKESLISCAPALKPQEVKKVILPNGLTILLYENSNLPIVSIRASMRGGVRVETEDNNGICNLMARLLLKGTKKRTAGDIANLVESIGGEVSSYSENNSFGIVLDILSQDLESGLEILSDTIFNSLFSEEEIEREKEEVSAEIKNEDDDIFKVSSKLMKKTIFKNHPYRFTNLGEKKTLDLIDRFRLLEFYKSYCLPDNMVLSIFGNIDSDKALDLVERYFGKVNSGSLRQISLPAEPPLGEIRESIKNIPKEEAVVMLGFPAVSVYDEEKFVFEVLASILSGSDGRLYDCLREKRGLAYALGAFLVSGAEPGYFCLYVATEPSMVSLTKDIILEEVESLRKEDIDTEEIEDSKNDLITRHLISGQTNRSLAFRSALDELYGLGYDEYTRYVEKIKAVSKEDIVSVVNRYFRPDGYAIVIINPNP